MSQEILPKYREGFSRTRLISSMSESSRRKLDFISEHNGRSEYGKQRKILDIGCCTGEILAELKVAQKNDVFLGIDLNRFFVEKAASKGGEVVQGDCFRLPLPERSIDVVYMLSVVHELYSYPQPKPTRVRYSMSNLLNAFQEINRVLVPSGKVIIIDSSKPSHPDEQVLIIPNYKNGLNPVNWRELIAANVTELSTGSLLKRFLLDFPLSETTQDEPLPTNDPMVLDAATASEFIRHRIFARHTSDWQSEIEESFCVLNEAGMKGFGREAGFDVELVESVYDPRNKYRFSDDELIIVGSDQREMSQEKDFPPYLNAVLRKVED